MSEWAGLWVLLHFMAPRQIGGGGETANYCYLAFKPAVQASWFVVCGVDVVMPMR